MLPRFGGKFPVHHSEAGEQCLGLCDRGRSQLDITMSRFKNDEVEIAYLDEGEGDPIVLVHGFASTK